MESNFVKALFEDVSWGIEGEPFGRLMKEFEKKLELPAIQFSEEKYPPEEILVKEEASLQVGTWSQQKEIVKTCTLCPRKCVEKPNLSIYQKDMNKDILILFLNNFFLEESDNTSNNILKEGDAILAKMINAMKLTPEEYFISYSLKCYLKEQINDYEQLLKNCYENLIREVFSLRPKIIVTLGAIPTWQILGKKSRLSKVNGRFIDKEFIYNNEKLATKIIPIFHPQYLVINPNMKKSTWENLKKIMKHVGKL